MSIDPAALPPLESVHSAHLIGVCGTGMSALARLFLDAGIDVVGTDLRADPPTGPALADWGVDIRLGYEPAHLDPAPDLVVVGNAVTKDNPVAVAAYEQGLAITHMPAAVDWLVGERPRLVVAGTHGKSTTTAIAAWLLHEAGLDPGWLIGASPAFGPSGRLGTGPFVIEGDEYNASFFDRRAKFFHYRPDHLAVTNVEFDHADLYDDLGQIEAAFAELIAGVPSGGTVILAPEADRLAPAAAASAPGGGRGAAATVQRLAGGRFDYRGSDPAGAGFELDGIAYRVPLPGRHGATDGALAVALARAAGAPPAGLAMALADYPGIALRQQVLVDGTVKVVRDFGHHPTEVRVTLAGLAEAHPGAALWAVFEPRSYTSRSARFQADYERALAGAERVYLMPVHRPEALADPPLNTAALAGALGPGARALEGTDATADAVLVDLAARDPEEPVVLVLFSNGTMDGLPARIVEELCP